MIETVFESTEPPFQWLDVTNPEPAELDALARAHGLHPTSVQDCLDPGHLPKFERIGDTTFVIVRAFDEASEAEADTTREMTRKTALFLREGFALSIHRKPQPHLDAWKAEGKAALAGAPRGAWVLLSLLDMTLRTYRKPLEEAEDALECFETQLFDPKLPTPPLQDVYIIKRRVSVLRWMSRHTLDTIAKLSATDRDAPLLQDLREEAQFCLVTADAHLEDAAGLIHLHLAMAAQRTNEVMRLLTIFSVFFMPLTFIVGIYGMNFENMPELKTRHGYFMVLGAMAILSLAILLWFRRKGWFSFSEVIRNEPNPKDERRPGPSDLR